MIIQRANMTSTLSAIGETIKLIADNLPKQEAEILDLGCGEGVYGMILKSLFRKKIFIDGVDGIEGQFVQTIYDKFTRTNMMLYHATTEYDAILMLHVLEHLQKLDAIKMIEHYKTIGDCIIIGLPNSRKGHKYRQNSGVHSHKWGIHDFPFDSLGLKRAKTKSNLYVWRK